MIDLHTHSTASDGSLTPGELVALAASRSICALALTDHDTMAGLPEAVKAGEERGIRIISGTEIDISWKPGECHLLGLGMSGCSPKLEVIFAALARNREQRNARIVDMLSKQGIVLDFARVAERAGGSVVGRIHFADELVAMGLVKKRQDAFDKWLAKGHSLFEEKGGVPLEEAIVAVHESGGLAVLAHPMSLFISRSKLSPLIGQWKELGLDGIEAWHSGAKEGACRYLDALARELGLLITAGSDYHGPNRPDRKLGMTAGKRKIEDHYLEALDEALSKARMSQGLSP